MIKPPNRLKGKAPWVFETDWPLTSCPVCNGSITFDPITDEGTAIRRGWYCGKCQSSGDETCQKITHSIITLGIAVSRQ